MRAPAIPLATVDPYFSLWCPADRLTAEDAVHWTGIANLLRGVAVIDGAPWRFLGRGPEGALEQVSLAVGFLSTTAVFQGAGVRLTVAFPPPLLPDALPTLSRPVSFVDVRAESADGRPHEVVARLSASEQFCLDKAGDAPVSTRRERYAPGVSGMSIGSAAPRVLERAGDNLRIEWGRLHLAAASADAKARSFREKDVEFLCRSLDEQQRDRCGLGWSRTTFREKADLRFVSVEAPVACPAAKAARGGGTLFLLAYDDAGASVEYFGRRLRSLWNADGATIRSAVAEAAATHDADLRRCDAWERRMAADARKAGGADYAALLAPAYRQAVAAHKLVVDDHGEMLWISKENFSNGSAATVDVSYPSVPLFLLYAPELVKAMMRPIYRFAATDAWKYDFAPHDAGTYPLVNGQTYGLVRETGELLLRKQMPVEECGNMLVMEAAAALASGDASFAASHMDVLAGWVKYLEENGEDPGEQLCTDDFAGHLAHNCNLSLKAILGIASFGILLGLLGDAKGREARLAQARKLARSWIRRAKNRDGSFRLAFDRPGTFSLKYNAVWDKVFRLGLFPAGTFDAELRRYVAESRPYGVPLDSRKTYAKSDWIVWAATLDDRGDVFERLVRDLVRFYDTTPNRVPMTDWFWTDTAQQTGFQARSVQGGLWMKVLADRGLPSR